MEILSAPLLVSMLFLMTGSWKFFLHSNSILTSLILLEIMALSVFFLVMIMSSCSPHSTFMALIFMTIAVCDSVLGISIMLMSARLSGNQFLKNQTLLKW